MTDAILVTPSVRPGTYCAKSYAAFRVTEGRMYPVHLGERPLTVLSAVDAALGAQNFYAKEQLIVRETDGATKIHIFCIKRQSAPTYVWRDHVQHRVHRHYADPLCVLDGDMLMGAGK